MRMKRKEIYHREDVWKVVLLVVLLTFRCSLFTASAQDDETMMRDVYAQAENDYRIGRTEQARDLLLQHLKAFDGNLRQSALRLIALSYLESFDIKQTERYASMILEQNPYYTVSAQDPPEFADIVNQIKAGMTATVTTASNISESLDEVPVPTTLITEEMIAASGGRNLQEVLAAYVPGISLVDCNNDINISMRSIHSSTQEKMLFMLNGHRLNSYLTNTAAPDFSISLEKVKQIEVLRGPASSLYGGVALAGVVNIITKQGADVNGVQIKAGVGNYGQLRGDVLIGRRLYDLDVLAWASLYTSKGERRTVGEEHWGFADLGGTIHEATVGRVGNLPTYDLGFQLSMKGWRLLYNTRFSQVVAPYTNLATTYDRDRYRDNNGIKPSFATASHHADLSYSHQAGPLSLSYGVHFDRGDMTRYKVVSEERQIGASTYYKPEYLELSEFGGLFEYNNAQEQNYGLRMKAGYDYTFGSSHKGSMLLGAEYSHFHLYGMHWQLGYNYDYLIPEIPEMRDMCLGHENSANVAFQLKHQWRSLILNAGVRYDHCHQLNSPENVSELSPRIALILLRPRWNMKLSYSKSFVDYPYIYQIGNIFRAYLLNDRATMIYLLEPERIHSWQLSVAGNNRAKSLNLEANLFYNRASNLIVSVYEDYTNSSHNEAIGLELRGSYHKPRFTADVNMTWTHVIKSSLNMMDSRYNDGDPQPWGADVNNNMPAIIANGVVAWKVTPNLKLHTHLLFESRQSTYFLDLKKEMLVAGYYKLAVEADERGDEAAAAELRAKADEEIRTVSSKGDMPARVIINLGGEYTLGPVTLGLNIHNLLNTSYNRSGINTQLIPQQGRWFMATVGVKL